MTMGSCYMAPGRNIACRGCAVIFELRDGGDSGNLVIAG